jgi:lactate dehydrogenase-like 2-hydroxyacid dehydrogenase
MSRMINTTGRRNSGIDIVHAKEKGIVICGTGYGEAGYMLILEHIWALIMATVRQIPLEDANIKEKNPQWQVSIAPCLWNKTLGLVGLGRLGKSLARV